MSGSASFLPAGRGFPDRLPSPMIGCNHDLFLAQKIEVGVTAGTSIDDCREVV
jgi:hypothetical protein